MCERRSVCRRRAALSMMLAAAPGCSCGEGERGKGQEKEILALLSPAPAAFPSPAHLPPFLPVARARSPAARQGTAAAALRQKLRGKLSPLARAPPLRGGAGRGGAERPSRLGSAPSAHPQPGPAPGLSPRPPAGPGGGCGEAVWALLWRWGGSARGAGAVGRGGSGGAPWTPRLVPLRQPRSDLCNLPSGPPLFAPLMFPISPSRVSPPSTHPQFSLPVKQESSHSGRSFLFIPSCTLQVGLQ